MTPHGKRPTPKLDFRARGFPPAWRAIIEPELNAAQMSMRSLCDGRLRGHAYEMRKRIWNRISAETGASASHIGKRFGFHHTTVLYSLGRIGARKGSG